MAAELGYLWPWSLALISALALAMVALALLARHRGLARARALRALEQAVRGLAEGEYAPRWLPLTRRDQVGKVAAALQETAAELGRQTTSLAAEKGRLALVLANMTSGVLFLDRRGRVVLTNRAARRLLELQGSPGGRHHLEVTRNVELSEAIDRVLQSGRPEEVEIEMIHPPGRVLQCHLAPGVEETTRPDGEDAGLVVVLHDISELRRLARVRAELVASVSHELKTPVTAIKGFAETLLEGSLEDPARAREFVGIIDREAGRLAHLIRDLLELSKLESGQIELKLQSVDLRQVARAVAQKSRPPAERAGLRLLEELPPEPVLALADQERVEQVLHNLVENSLRYTPSGGQVVIRVSGGEAPLLAVSDTGIGIAREDLSRVFERFYRADRARSRKLGGSGLGLAIVKHIVEALGGKVWAESEPGHGSTFYVKLPSAFTKT